MGWLLGGIVLLVVGLLGLVAVAAGTLVGPLRRVRAEVAALRAFVGQASRQLQAGMAPLRARRKTRSP